MSTPNVTPQQSDPFAEFGGQSTGTTVAQPVTSQPTQSDPFAEFGGVAVKPNAAQTPNAGTFSAADLQGDESQSSGSMAIPHVGPAGQPNPNNIYRATDEESTPEGAAAALARRQAAHPILTGIGQGAESLLQPVFHPIDTVENIVKQSFPAFQLYDSTKKSYALIQQYEKARAQGKSFWQSMSDVNDYAGKQDAAHQALEQAISDYKTNPTQTTAKILTQVAGNVALLVAGGRGATMEAEAPTVAETPAAEAAAEAPAASELSPVESAVSRTVAKSKLPEGRPATLVPTGEKIQPTLQQGIRDTMDKVAEENGVAKSTAKSIRDVVKETADNIYAKSKSQFAVLDEATGGNVSRFDEQLRNVNRALSNVTDDAEEAKLLTRKTELETKQEAAFKEAEDAGVSRELVDEARANYKKAQALYDVDNQVKMSTSGTRPNIGKAGAQTPEIVDPKKLSIRLNKVYDSGRLQDAVGEDNAQDLMTHADDAQVAGQQIKEFVPSSPTGQKAFADLIRPNTGTGVTGRATGIPQLRQLLGFKPTTNWLGVYRDMSGVSADEMAARFGADAPQVRAYVTSQARRQIGMMIVKGYALKKIAEQTAIPTSILHVLAGSE